MDADAQHSVTSEEQDGVNKMADDNNDEKVSLSQRLARYLTKILIELHVGYM